MVNDKIIGVIDILDGIKLDNNIPKNIRAKINEAICCLNDNNSEDLSLRLNKLLNKLEEVTEDPNIPSYTRVELLNIIGILGDSI